MRLWCAWELMVRVAFQSTQHAADCITLLQIPDGSFDVFKTMKSFDVTDAHCFDPNEECKMHNVIEAVGKEHFNEQVCSVFTMIQGQTHMLQVPSVCLLFSLTFLFLFVAFRFP